MQRWTISVDDDLAEHFDKFVAGKGYSNRSEAFRDLVRKELGQSEMAGGKAKWCVATVTYLYNHHERMLTNRLNQLQHDHHGVAAASQHVHLDHDNCLETVILKGRVSEVRACAEAMVAQTGGRHGNIHIVPLEPEKGTYLRVKHGPLAPASPQRKNS